MSRASTELPPTPAFVTAETAQRLADRAAGFVNVFDYGAVADGAAGSLTKDAAAGSTSLVVSPRMPIREGVGVHGPGIAADCTVAAVSAAGDALTVTLDTATQQDLAAGATLYFGTDNLAAFRAAQADIQNSELGCGTIYIPGGRAFYLSEMVYVVSGAHWATGAGVHIVGTGGLEGIVDAVNNVGFAFGVCDHEAANASSLFVSALFHATGGTTPSQNYQKNGLYVRVQNGDPSTYRDNDAGTEDGMFTGDVVGIESQASIVSGNQSGRVWGYHAGVNVHKGADGSAWLAELELYNGAPYHPEGNRQNRYTKMGIHLDLSGNDANHSMAWDGGARWYNIFRLDQHNVRRDGHVLNYRCEKGEAPVATIDYSGAALFSRLTVGDSTRGMTSLLTLQGSFTNTAERWMPIPVSDANATGLTDGSDGLFQVVADLTWHDTTSGDLSTVHAKAIFTTGADPSVPLIDQGRIEVANLSGRPPTATSRPHFVVIDNMPVICLETNSTNTVAVCGTVMVTRLSG